ncbi:GNAT family N-acetyltransferase, partial [Lactococcus garvieae]|uniref:GNAT family N-acetyltransferase n=1 Tax=Lactococcus garvieae TaxID=1363 RepID=UPI00254E632A
NNSVVSAKISKSPSSSVCYCYEKNSKCLAGISLEYYYGIMHINFLWVDKELRGNKIGEQLLLIAEELARKVECSVIHLETFSFQAPEFYKKNGFEEFGKLENILDNKETLYFMKKVMEKEIYENCPISKKI